MSLQEAATTINSSNGPERTPTPDDDEGIAYNFSTSLIVRTAVAAGIIVLVLTALVLFFNISQWLRNRRRRLNRRQKSRRRQMEQRASKYEMAAWIGTDAVDIDDRGRDGDGDGHDFTAWTRMFRSRSKDGRAGTSKHRQRHGNRKKDKARDVRDGRNAIEVEEPDEGHAQ